MISKVKRRGQMRYQRALLALLALFLTFFVIHKPLMIRICPLKYAEEIWISAKENELSPYLVASMIRVESNFQRDAISPKGATGLMQLMPSTAVWVAEQKGITLDEDKLTDPVINIALGTYYFRTLFEKWGKVPALAAYNAGRGNLEKWLNEGIWDGSWDRRGDIPFYETQDYVRKVIILEKWYNYLYSHIYSRELVVWNKNINETK